MYIQPFSYARPAKKTPFPQILRPGPDLNCSVFYIILWSLAPYFSFFCSNFGLLGNSMYAPDFLLPLFVAYIFPALVLLTLERLAVSLFTDVPRCRRLFLLGLLKGILVLLLLH